MIATSVAGGSSGLLLRDRRGDHDAEIAASVASGLPGTPWSDARDDHPPAADA